MIAISIYIELEDRDDEGYLLDEGKILAFITSKTDAMVEELRDGVGADVECEYDI